MRHVTLKKSTYRDSVSLMRISKLAGELPAVTYVMVAMATDTNVDLLKEAGFDQGELATAEPNDLIIAVELEDDSVLGSVVETIEKEIRGGAQPATMQAGEARLSLDATLKAHPDINLVLISVPGRYAAYEARKALEAGRHIMIFSDNVTVEDERELKQYAASRDLLVMGPDCGTAIINGVGLGFANEVPGGDVGMVAASGTGAQEVSSILARSYGVGISQMIGTGGRDISSEVGGTMLKLGLTALIDDPATRTIVVVSKHPAAEIAGKIAEIAKAGKKPCIIHFTGQKEPRRESNLVFTGTLAETAAEAARATGKKVESVPGFDPEVKDALFSAFRKLSPGRKYVRGLFSGGTLAQEAVFLLSRDLEEINTNLNIEGFPRLKDPHVSKGHTIVDLGDDAFTRGRAHPMIDQAYRLIRLEKELAAPETAVILLDIVLGYGCHEAPGAEIASALTQMRARAGDRGGQGDRGEQEDRGGQEVRSQETAGPLVLASICGTPGDPQDYAGERKALEEAGVFLAEHNQGLCELAMAALKGRRNE